MSELTSKLEQAKRDLEETTTSKNKLASENSEQAGQIEDLDSQLNQLTKAKSSLSKQLEEARVGLEEESRLKSKFQSEAKMLQSDLDSLKEQYEEEEVCGRLFGVCWVLCSRFGGLCVVGYMWCGWVVKLVDGYLYDVVGS